MTDDAYFQDGDQLSEGNLGKALLADNNKDYFDRGGGITGPSGGEITVEAAQAFIEDTSSEQLYKVYPTAETLVLPVASGNNYVYATFDPATQDSATWEVTDTQGSGLTNPVSLLRAVVDTSSSSVGLRNDDPVGSFELVSTDSLVIGGTLYEEDDNSPINVTNTSSVTFSLADSADGVLIIPQDDLSASFNQLQVNGDTGANYDYVDTSDAETQGKNQWDIPNLQRVSKLKLMGVRGNKINFGLSLTGSFTAETDRGENRNVTAPITQITLKDDGGVTRDAKARVYRRLMDI